MQQEPNKLQQLYGLYEENDLLGGAEYELFEKANDEQRKQLFELAASNGVLGDVDFETFNSAWDVKKKDDAQSPSPSLDGISQSAEKDRDSYLKELQSNRGQYYTLSADKYQLEKKLEQFSDKKDAQGQYVFDDDNELKEFNNLANEYNSLVEKEQKLVGREKELVTEYKSKFKDQTKDSEEDKNLGGVTDWLGQAWNSTIKGISNFSNNFTRGTGFNDEKNMASFIQENKDNYPELYSKYQENIDQRNPALLAFISMPKEKQFEIGDRAEVFRRTSSEKEAVKELGVDIEKDIARNIEETFLGGAISGLGRSIPAMALSASTMGMSFFDQSYQDAEQKLVELENRGMADMSRSDKETYKLVNAAASLALERVGLSNVFKGTSLSKKVAEHLGGKVFNRVAMEAAKTPSSKITKEGFDKILNEETSEIIKYLKRTGQSGLSEFETGALQNLTTDLTEQGINAIKGKEVFDEKTVGKIAYDAIYSGGQEMFGGFVMGATINIANKENPTIDEKNEFIELVSNDKNFDKISKELSKESKKKTISGRKAKKTLDKINEYRKASQATPENLDKKTRVEAVDLIREKQRLQEAMSNKDDAFKKPFEEKINKIDERLSKIEIKEPSVQETEAFTEREQEVESEQPTTEETQPTEIQEDAIQERETTEVPSEPEAQPIQEMEGEVRGEREGQEGTQEGRIEDAGQTQEDVSDTATPNRAIQDLAPTYKDGESFGKQVEKALKPFTKGKGKITNTQATTLSKRAANVQNQEQLGKFLDYAQKVLTKSNYVADVAKSKRRAKSGRKKYKQGLLSIDGGNTLRALRIDPEELSTEDLDRYNNFLDRLNKADYSSFDPQNIEDIEYFSSMYSPKEKVEKGEKQIGEKAQATLDELKTKYKEAVSQQREAEIDNEVIENDLGILESLTDSELSSLNKQELEAVNTAILDAKQGFPLNSRASKIVRRVEENRVVDNLKPAISGKQFTNLLRSYFNPKRYISKKKGTKERIADKIRNTPLSRIDTIVKGVMDASKPIYKNLIQPISQAYSRYEGEVRRFESELNRLVDKIKKKDKRDASIRLALIGLAKQKAANPNSDELFTVEQYMENIINDGKNINDYSELAEEYEKVYNELKGNDEALDWQKAYKSLPFEERQVFDYVEKHFAKQAEKVQIAAAKNSEGAIIYDFYNPIKVLYKDKGSIDQILEKANKFTEENTPKSPNLKSRNPSNGDLIFLEFFDNAQNSTRSVLRDYFLREPLRVASGVMKKLKEDSDITGDSKDFVSALDDTIKEVTKNLFINTEYEGNKFFEFLKSRGYERDLVSIPRAATELISNVLHGITYAPIDLATGTKYLSQTNKTDLMELANLIGTSQFSRLFQGEGTVRAEMGGIGKRSVNKWDKMLKGISTDILSKPDQAVAKPLWMGSFLNSFKKETGQEFDSDRFVEDLEYRKQVRDAVNKARDVADGKLSQGFASMNPYDGIVEAQIKRSDNLFKTADKYMTRFMKYEFQSAVDAINGMLGRGDISRTEASQLMLATLLRMSAYQAGLFTLQNLFFSGIEAGLSAATGADVGDREEDDFDKILKRSKQSLLASGMSLAMLRRLGNFGRIPIVGGVEFINYLYGDDIGLRDSEAYDSFEDALLYSPAIAAVKIGADYRNWYTSLLDFGASATGPLNKLVKSTGRLIEDAVKSQTLKTPEAKDRRYKRLSKDIFDVSSVLFGIPMARDISNLISREVFEDYVNGVEDKKKGRTKSERTSTRRKPNRSS